MDGKQQELRKISLYIYRLKLLNISTEKWMMKLGVVVNENEAIEIMKNFPQWNLDDQWLDESDMQDLSYVVIKVLEEIQQYREL